MEVEQSGSVRLALLTAQSEPGVSADNNAAASTARMVDSVETDRRVVHAAARLERLDRKRVAWGRGAFSAASLAYHEPERLPLCQG